MSMQVFQCKLRLTTLLALYHIVCMYLCAFSLWQQFCCKACITVLWVRAITFSLKERLFLFLFWQYYDHRPFWPCLFSWINIIYIYLPSSYSWQRHFQYCWFHFFLFLCIHTMLTYVNYSSLCFPSAAPQPPQSLLLLYVDIPKSCKFFYLVTKTWVFMRDYVE